MLEMPGVSKNNVMQDTEFMTAKEKEHVLKDWESFLKSNFKRQYFKERLYKHLILHCSFIAHYDINGFYSTYFERGDDTIHLLSQFDRAKGCRGAELGGYSWINYPGMNDINNAMCEIASKYISVLVKAAAAKQKEADLAAARYLLQKHHIKSEF